MVEQFLGYKKYTPRDYQAEAVDHALAAIDTPILCSPTGSGKTLIELWIADWFVKRNKRVVILTPREEILEQMVTAAHSIVGFNDTGIVKAGHKRSPYRPLQICSWPTLRSRAVDAHRKGRDLDMVMPPADLCIVDEAHLSASPQMRHFVIGHYEKERAKRVGASATPSTKSGQGLGSVYTSIKHVTTVRRLIAEGHLVPMEYWGGKQVDLMGVQFRNGDWVAKQQGASVSRLVGDYVENWLRLASDRHTIVFTPDRASCEGVTECFQQAGISALSLHGGKSEDRRHKIVHAFRNREVQVLVNVEILTYGFDCPEVECLQVLRHTKSSVLHLQMLGRGMRPFEDEHHKKTECIAGGQLVLTDIGMVPIERVTRAMKVWDGVAFVEHGGVVSNGKREVIEYAGLVATPDHEVWTAEGVKKPFAESAAAGDALAVTEYGGAAVRAGDRYYRGAYTPGQESTRVFGGPLRRLWRPKREIPRQHRARHGWLSAMCDGGKRFAGVVIATLRNGKTAMREPEGRSLRALRRARDRISLLVADSYGPVHCQASWYQETSADRPQRQRGALRARQPQVGHHKRESTQFTAGHREAEVYDIVNAGPRHRFTVSGVLVSNCVVLDHTRNCKDLGYAEELYRWRLRSGPDAVVNWSRDARNPENNGHAEPEPHECQNCHQLFSRRLDCPNCGLEIVLKKRYLETSEANLVRISKDQTGDKQSEMFLPKGKALYLQLLSIQERRGYRPKWAKTTFKDITDRWPSRYWEHDEAIPASPEVLACVQKRIRAFRARRQRAKKAAANG